MGKRLGGRGGVLGLVLLLWGCFGDFVDMDGRGGGLLCTYVVLGRIDDSFEAGEIISQCT